jgi:hypothetical protein
MRSFFFNRVALVWDIFFWSVYSVQAEFLDVTTLYTQSINIDNGVNPRYTPVQHSHGKTFLVMPDA